MATVDPERFKAAARRFRAFFEELRGAFVERDDVLTQMALALLSKEHLLLTGPPGTAKSQLASSVLGRIVCETTGAPSLFARQITESTVQTDLIGPIDFKNLTETGRTTHFTDEGMLGAAHAFLDEVFDGRDMLLRSALNVLQERELKQGNVITRGRIECALMTSNRYIAEVLEQSRDTLLAFVDRIAFVGFVPRGFSEPDHLAKILRRRMGSGGKLVLDALLTIQDLDVLQAAVDEVYVAPELCDLLASLLTSFDGEVATATRADPAFVPTRYVSTRTAVRSAGLLRAACVYDKVMRFEHRSLDAVQGDLAWLRLHLLLSGPAPHEAEAILQREVDSTERRQLGLLMKEREIFDACLRKLPTPTLTPRPRPRAAPPPLPPSARPPAPAATAPSAPPPPPPDPLAALERRVHEAAAGGAVGELVTLLAELAEQSREGAPERERAHALLERATAAIAAEGLRATLRLSEPDQSLVAAVRSVVELASSLEDGTTSMHATARWMHERALEMLEQAALFATGLDASTLVEVAQAGGYDAAPRSERVLGAIAEIAELRRHLLAQAASRGLETDDETWTKTLERVESDLAALWARSFADTAAGLLDDARGKGLGSLLEALGPRLEQLDGVDRRLGSVRGTPGRIKDLVVGPRLVPLLDAALDRVDLKDRERLLLEVGGLCRTLRDHGLGGAISLAQWVALVAEALRRAEPAPDEPLVRRHDLEGYRTLRAREQRTPLACTLAEAALVVDPVAASTPREGAPIGLPKVLGLLDDPLRQALVKLDLARVSRAVTLLEEWWATVAPANPCEPTEDERAAIHASEILKVVRSESALARFALETRLVEELLPESSTDAVALRHRIETLYERIRGAGLGIAEERARAAWERALGAR